MIDDWFRCIVVLTVGLGERIPKQTNKQTKKQKNKQGTDEGPENGRDKFTLYQDLFDRQRRQGEQPRRRLERQAAGSKKIDAAGNACV